MVVVVVMVVTVVVAVALGAVCVCVGVRTCEQYARIRSNMGESYLKQNKYEAAVQQCSHALAADPCNVKAWYRRYSAGPNPYYTN